MTWLTTYRPVNQRRREWNSLFDEFFNDFFTPVKDAQESRESFVPRIDVEENETAYLIKGEFPGVEKDDIQIELNNDLLTISGEKKCEVAKDEKNYHRREISYGTFTRSFRLPENVDADGVEAEYKNGILTLQIPKSDRKEVKKITIS